MAGRFSLVAVFFLLGVPASAVLLQNRKLRVQHVGKAARTPVDTGCTKAAHGDTVLATACQTCVEGNACKDIYHCDGCLSVLEEGKVVTHSAGQGATGYGNQQAKKGGEAAGDAGAKKKGKHAPWTVNPADFSDSMTMTALVILDGAPQTVGTLAAFVDGTDEVRGVGQMPMPVPFGKHEGKHLYSIMIYANAGGDVISFKFMKGDGEEVGLKEKYVFQINANKGNHMDPEVLTNDEPPAPDQLPDLPAPAPGWVIDHAKFENSMTVTFDVAIDGDLKSTGELAAFAGEEIRGLSTPEKGLLIPPFGPFKGKPVYQLMIYADKGGEPITFKYKTVDGAVYPLEHKQTGTKVINFRANGNMGNVQQPVDAVNY